MLVSSCKQVSHTVRRLVKLNIFEPNIIRMEGEAFSVESAISHFLFAHRNSNFMKEHTHTHPNEEWANFRFCAEPNTVSIQIHRHRHCCSLIPNRNRQISFSCTYLNSTRTVWGENIQHLTKKIKSRQWIGEHQVNTCW